MAVEKRFWLRCVLAWLAACATVGMVTSPSAEAGTAMQRRSAAKSTAKPASKGRHTRRRRVRRGPRPTRHRVAKGQRLGSIAKRYNLTVAQLCEANGIQRRARIKPGQVLVIPPRGGMAKAEDDPAPKKHDKRRRRGAPKKHAAEKRAKKAKAGKVRWHKVYKGQRPGTIARRYGITLAALRRANDLGPRSRIKTGQRLVIPARSDTTGEAARLVRLEGTGVEGGAAVRHDDGTSGRYQRYLAKPPRRGYLTLVGRHGRSFRGYAVRRGRISRATKSAMSRVLATADDQRIAIAPRLIRLITRVSDAFGGRRIHVVSGYRLGKTSKTSRHRHGRAMDFRVEGVPSTAVRDYVKTFERVGVGYYPKSKFIHLDVRNQWTYWIDNAGPGQPAQYVGFWTRGGSGRVVRATVRRPHRHRQRQHAAKTPAGKPSAGKLSTGKPGTTPATPTAPTTPATPAAPPAGAPAAPALPAAPADHAHPSHDHH